MLQQILSSLNIKHVQTSPYEFIGRPLDNKFEITQKELLDQVSKQKPDNSSFLPLALEIVNSLYKNLGKGKKIDNNKAIKFIDSFYQTITTPQDILNADNVDAEIFAKQNRYIEASKVIYNADYFKEIERKTGLFRTKFSEITVAELESLETEGLDGYKYIFCKILQGNQLIDYDISVGELMKLVNLNEKIKFAGDTVNHIYHVLDIRRTENPAVYDFLFCPKRGENVQ